MPSAVAARSIVLAHASIMALPRLRGHRYDPARKFAARLDPSGCARLRSFECVASAIQHFAMESSSVLAFRIFVMLSCLIIVPMAAIFGSRISRRREKRPGRSHCRAGDGQDPRFEQIERDGDAGGNHARHRDPTGRIDELGAPRWGVRPRPRLPGNKGPHRRPAWWPVHRRTAPWRVAHNRRVLPPRPTRRTHAASKPLRSTDDRRRSASRSVGRPRRAAITVPQRSRADSQ